MAVTPYTGTDLHLKSLNASMDRVDASTAAVRGRKPAHRPDPADAATAGELAQRLRAALAQKPGG